MIFLAGSIIFSSFLTIAFKICERMGISSFQAIIFNYLTCIITGCFINGGIPDPVSVSAAPWAPWTLLMGLFFITFFNITALTVKTNGLAVASVANKLSLVIPFLFSLYLYNEHADIWNIAGVVVALLAVILTCYPAKKELIPSGSGSHSLSFFLLPAVLFLGSGLLDTIIKFTEQKYITADNRNVYLIACFTIAFITGALFFLYKLYIRNIRFEPKAIIAGICIGIPNYLSIWCLVIVLDKYKFQSAAIIPVNNIGIVFISALVAALFFREKLSVINWVGILLAMISILMITSAI